MDVIWRSQLREVQITKLLMAIVLICVAPGIHAEQHEIESSNGKTQPANALKQLQGKWRSVKSTYKNANYLAGCSLRYSDDKAIEVMQVRNKEPSEEDVGQMHFSIDETKNPMWIDFEKAQGIFRIEGDLLIICIGNETYRPTEFNLVAVPEEIPTSTPDNSPKYPQISSSEKGFWVPAELSWERDLKLFVFKKAP